MRRGSVLGSETSEHCFHLISNEADYLAISKARRCQPPSRPGTPFELSGPPPRASPLIVRTPCDALTSSFFPPPTDWRKPDLLG